jgi:hypothetical protein
MKPATTLIIAAIAVMAVIALLMAVDTVLTVAESIGPIRNPFL